MPVLTPSQQCTCSSLCSWFLSWLFQRHLSSPPSVEYASCPSRGYPGWHCSSSSVIAWHSARTWDPAHADPPHYWQIVPMASSSWHITLPSVQVLHCRSCYIGVARTFRFLWTFLWSLDWPQHATWQISLMAAIAQESWSCSSPMSWHCPAEVGFMAFVWSSGSGSTSPQSADDLVWWSHSGAIKWGKTIGIQQLGVTASGELSWDMIRDALIRGVTIGGNTCPTEEVGRLMVSFLQRLPLPRLVHFLDMILPQMVPVQSPCHSRRRRFASSYRVEERLAWGDQGVHSHGGMYSQRCPDVGSLASCVEHPAIDPGKRFIRLADDNPAHLCCQHDLHELYGE